MRLKILATGSKGNCYLLEGKNERLMLECGVDYNRTILRGLHFYLSDVVGCLITHKHKDHSKAIKGLISKGIDVYTSKATAEACGAIGHRIKHIESEQQFNVGEFTIMPFETQHDCEGSLGFLIQHQELGKLLFITDSYYCQYNFKGLNHIMIECNYSKEILQENIEKGLNQALANRLLKSHFSLDNVKEFLKANDLSEVRDITLIHLSDGNSNAKQFKSEIERLTGKPVYIADKGLEIEM